jgi:hypothetical protein
LTSHYSLSVSFSSSGGTVLGFKVSRLSL